MIHEKTNALFFNFYLLHKKFAVSSGIIKHLAWFGTDKILRSGWSWGEAYLKNGVTAFEASVGKGKLYAFTPEITFRAQSWGMFKLLFNQLYVQ